MEKLGPVKTLWVTAARSQSRTPAISVQQIYKGIKRGCSNSTLILAARS